MAVKFNLDSLFRSGRAVLAQRITLTETGTTFVALDPTLKTQILLNKQGSAVTLQDTNDYIQGGDVDNAIFSTLFLSEATGDYEAGQSDGLTGLKLVVGTYAADVDFVVIQYRVG